MIVFFVTLLGFIVMIVLIGLMMWQVRRGHKEDVVREGEAEGRTQAALLRVKDELIAGSHDLYQELELLRMGRRSRQ